MLYELDGIRPQIAPDAFVAPDAAVIGDVWLGAQSSIWFQCLVRGDTNRIRIGARTNVQDGTVIHVNPGEEWVTKIGDDVTIGHGCIIHACRLMDKAFVGMGATVLDGAVIEEGAMLAAGGLLTPGKRIPRLELWAGAPAKKLRDITPEARLGLDRNAISYVAAAARFRTGLRPIG